MNSTRGVYLSVFLFLFFQIYAVRSVVPNKSNNEIVLVLQQFDFNVDKAVQAFVDGRYTCPPEVKCWSLLNPIACIVSLK